METAVKVSGVATMMVSPKSKPDFVNDFAGTRLQRISTFESKKNPGTFFSNFEKLDAAENDTQKIVIIPEEIVSAFHTNHPECEALITAEGLPAKVGDVAYWNDNVPVKMVRGNLDVA